MPVAEFTSPVPVRASLTERAGASIESISSAAAQQPEIPKRYALREKNDIRYIECDEAPRLRAIIDSQMSVSRSGAASLGPRVILLDGAGSFGPLIDNDEKLYNLDHHSDCERLFTLSTCEQALLLVHSGLDLSEGDWKIYANDPDLDTVLAIWCLLNYRRVRELSPEARDVLLPLFRLEGAIDANGPELASLCGLSSDNLERTLQRIDHLLARERELKQARSWTKKRLLPYTLQMLRAVDALVYAAEDFGDYARIDAIYGHVEVAPGRVAVVCRDAAGIYAVEQHLKSRWGDQLSLIALENEPGQYTLRRVTKLSGPKLGPAYDRLNRVDEAVDGHPLNKRWGGSEDIGGSPRPAGTMLSAEELLQNLERAYRPSTRWRRIRASIAVVLAGVSCMFIWPLASFFPTPTSLPGFRGGLTASHSFGLASLILLTVGMFLAHSTLRRRPWVYGWRTPIKGGGAWLFPILLLGSLPVAAWLSTSVGTRGVEISAGVAAGWLAITSGEIWFRGLVHGLLVPDYSVQRPQGAWQISRGAFASSLAYAVVATVMARPVLDHALFPQLGVSEAELVLGILVLFFAVGLALAAFRERSLSFLPGLAIQLVGFSIVAAIYGVGA
jgi:hypothetical protein